MQHHFVSSSQINNVQLNRVKISDFCGNRVISCTLTSAGNPSERGLLQLNYRTANARMKMLLVSACLGSALSHKQSFQCTVRTHWKLFYNCSHP
uniref:Uncharacterized protein n=1 Tax=Anguilla anguilla TaxID=7936 RepID=A0A0E9SZ33_ANGAN